MATLTKQGDSVEGLKVEGNSRRPLFNRGLVYHNGIKCYRFLAEFNIKSKIVEQLSKETIKIEQTAHVSFDDEILCDGAVIHSLKDKYSKYLGSNVSATHSSNLWYFPNQSNVRITKSHQEIENAIRKRELKN
jgi:hypothetical protein